MKNQLMKRMITAALVAATLASQAIAQLDPGDHWVMQGGAKVGEIYRAPGATMYAEHWVLFANYVEPSNTNGVKTTIVPAPQQLYRSEADFLLHSPWGTGFRYMHVGSNESQKLPAGKLANGNQLYSRRSRRGNR